MKLWVWIVLEAGVLVLGILTGFWIAFTPTHPNPNPAFKIGQDDRMIPAVKGAIISGFGVGLGSGFGGCKEGESLLSLLNLKVILLIQKKK